MIQEEIEAGIETETGIVTGDETDQGQETGNEGAEVAIEDAIEAEIGEGAAAETEREARDHAAVVAIEKGDGKKEKNVRPEVMVTVSASRKNRQILVIMTSTVIIMMIMV